MPEASGSGVGLADVDESVDGVGETEVDGVGTTEDDGEGGGSVGLGAGEGPTVGDPVLDELDQPLVTDGVERARPMMPRSRTRLGSFPSR